MPSSVHPFTFTPAQPGLEGVTVVACTVQAVRLPCLSRRPPHPYRAHQGRDDGHVATEYGQVQRRGSILIGHADVLDLVLQTKVTARGRAAGQVTCRGSRGGSAVPRHLPQLWSSPGERLYR